jgi:hypothetical protein
MKMVQKRKPYLYAQFPLSVFFIIFLMGWDWVHLVLLPLFGLLYQPQMTDDNNDDCGVIGGMRINRRNRSTRRKPAPVPLCPPQIPHDLTRARTRAAAVGSLRLIAWAMARPLSVFNASLYGRDNTSAINWRGQLCSTACFYFFA